MSQKLPGANNSKSLSHNKLQPNGRVLTVGEILAEAQKPAAAWWQPVLCPEQSQPEMEVTVMNGPRWNQIIHAKTVACVAVAALVIVVGMIAFVAGQNRATAPADLFALEEGQQTEVLVAELTTRPAAVEAKQDSLEARLGPVADGE